MNLVVAVKAEPTRKIRQESADRVTILLVESEEAADTKILHRDKAFLNKLEGTCFVCNKLSANPPQDLCDVPPVNTPNPDPCVNYDDPCVCFNCPDEPTPRTCPEGYFAPTANLQQGSGYWVGLQGTSYYSNINNGGWLVAVSCSGGEVIGAFPVTNGNFGYGAGNIAGISVMVYPAGTAYGAGLSPANETSFPILGLTTNEGDELISGGSFSIVTSFSSGSFNPSNTSYAANFCPPVNSSVVNARVRNCLARWGDDAQCPIFNGQEVGPNDQFGWKDVTLDLANVIDNDLVQFENNAGVYTGNNVFTFVGSSGQNYTAAAEMTKIPSDAISFCGEDFGGSPICVCNSCKTCQNCAEIIVDCQYLMNNFKGPYSARYGGYNSAETTGDNFYAIGPNGPPKFFAGELINPEDTDAVEEQDTFWEDYWEWDPDNDILTYQDETSLITQQYVIAPISYLYENCGCPPSADPDTADPGARESKLTQQKLFIEGFVPCVNGCNELNANLFRREFFQSILLTNSGFKNPCSKCLQECISPVCTCQSKDCKTDPGLFFSYIPCVACSGQGGDELNGQQSITSFFETQAYSSYPVTSTTSGFTSSGANGEYKPEEPSSGMQLCNNILSSFINSNCGPCNYSNLTITDENGVVTVNVPGYLRCANHNLNDPCNKEKYLPRAYKDSTLNFNIDAVNGDTLPPNSSPVFARFIEVDGTTAYNILKNQPNSQVGGPFSTSASNCLVIAAFYGKCGCEQEVTESVNICGDDIPTDQETIRIKQLQLTQGVCIDSDTGEEATPEEVPDPCSCCNKKVNESTGEIENIPGTDCPSCCGQPDPTGQLPNACPPDPSDPNRWIVDRTNCESTPLF